MTVYVCVDPAWRTCAFTLILVEKEEKEQKKIRGNPAQQAI